ncbi:MAG: DMT family transporter [Deltaproteobacteria bacterium]|nr:DMT family transporter [Deltaproteobacteria bacterium]
MAEYFSLQAALCFAVSHIFIRRGLVTSDAFTCSFISLGMTAVTLWLMAPFFASLSSFWTPAVGYFVAAGFFAPALGRIFTYMGIERIGVSRSVPVSNSSPLVASIIAVVVVGEIWTALNFLGTTLVVLGVIVLSRSGAGDREWRRIDMIFPILASLAFGISANLRKLGLLAENIPHVAATVTATTGFLFAVALLQTRGGFRSLVLAPSGCAWFFAAGVGNTAAMLSVFYALSLGRVVIVEPLVAANPALSILLSAIFLKDLEVITPRVLLGAGLTVVGTTLVAVS